MILGSNYVYSIINGDMYEGSTIQRVYDRVYGKSPIKINMQEATPTKVGVSFTPNKIGERTHILTHQKENSSAYLNRAIRGGDWVSPNVQPRTPFKHTADRSAQKSHTVNNENYIYRDRGSSILTQRATSSIDSSPSRL